MRSRDDLSVFLFGTGPLATAAMAGLSDVPAARLEGLCGEISRMSFRERIARWLELERVRNTPPAPFRVPRGVMFFDLTEMERAAEHVIKTKPDIILCCGFPKLLPNAILQSAGHAINIHPGLLPERAGGTPNRWAVRLGDASIGVTAHYMNDRFDAGDIVRRVELPLPRHADAGDAEQSQLPVIEKMVAEIARHVALDSGPFERTPQLDSRPMKSLRKGAQFVDWERDSAESIIRLSLAMRPRTGAQTRHNDRIIVLWDLEIGGEQPRHFAPGVVSNIDPEGPRIATVGGSIVVHQALLGGQVRSGRDLKLRIGDRLR